MTFWSWFWLLVWTFFFVAYLIMLFHILRDLFRDRGTSGIAKAGWVVALLVFPLLAALVYLVARGSGMAEREMERTLRREGQSASGGLPAGASWSASDQLPQAQSLFDSGAISAEEYSRLKARSPQA